MRDSAEFLRCYEEELEALRQGSRAFAIEYPAHAAALRLEDVADPSVSRLSESVAFLAARTRVKISRSEEQIARELLARVTPFLAAPIPSIGVVCLSSQLGVDGLAEPVSVRGGSELVLNGSEGGSGSVFRTVRTVNIQPIALVEARLLTHASLPSGLRESFPRSTAGAYRLQFRRGEADLDSTRNIDRFQIFLNGKSPTVSQVLSAILFNGSAAVASADGGITRHHVRADLWWPPASEQWIPHAERDFNVYRRVVEFFACPEAWQFLDLDFRWASDRSFHLGPNRDFQLFFPLPRQQYEQCQQAPAIEWRLGAVPVINAYQRTTDRIPHRQGRADLKLYVDRMATSAYEILSVIQLNGHFSDGRKVQIRSAGAPRSGECGLQFHFRRDLIRPWRERDSLQFRARDLPSSYGREPTTQPVVTFVHLDSPADFGNLESVSAVCMVSDGDRPYEILRTGGFFSRSESLGDIDIEWMTSPRRSYTRHLVEPQGWRLVELLRPASQWLLPGGADTGERVRALLQALLLNESADALAMVDSIRFLQIRESVARIPGQQRLAFCRGLRVELHTCDSDIMAAPLFLLSFLLDRLFSEMSALNSFTQLVVVNQGRIPGWEFQPRVSAASVL